MIFVVIPMSEDTKLKVLFLTPWYPHRYDAMSGLFVRKHAQSVARQGVDVGVMMICDQAVDEGLQIEDEMVDGVREIILYTNKKGSVSEILALRKLWEYWYKTYGLPDVVHVNVLTKQGLLAWWLNVKYGVPYVVMEHWSGYLPENGDYKGFMRERMSEMIASRAAAMMPVSVKLMEAMKMCGLKHNNWQVVPNVVDDFFYKKGECEKREKFRFLHVSCFDNRAKNTLAIMEAVEKLSKQRLDFEMIMVGTGQDIFFTRCLADNYKLESRGLVKFVGEQRPIQVKEWMDASDCFVLFSNYETAAVVLEEAAACGLPMISTPVGIAEEVIDGDGGIIVPIGEVERLVEAMSKMIDNEGKYDSNKIKEKAGKYSFGRVGNQLVEIYRSQL